MAEAPTPPPAPASAYGSAGPAPSSPPPPPRAIPASDRIRGVIQAVLAYLSARLRLAQIEAGEAGGKLIGVLVRVVIGLGTLAGAWVLLVTALVAWLARLLQQPWEYIAAAAGALHLLVAAVAFLSLRSSLRGLKLFEETLNQFERDRAWAAPEKTPSKRNAV